MHNLLCPRCGATIHKDARFCGSCSLFLPSGAVGPVNDENPPSTEDHPVPLVVDDYAISVDLEVCQNLQRIPVLRQAVEAFIQHWTNPFKRAELLGDGVRVSATQLPTLYDIAASASRLLRAPCPDFFIKQDPTLNAYTLGTNQDHIVVIHSGLLNMLEPDELVFVISHEIGHIASRHVTYMTMGRLMAQGLGILVKPLFVPIATALNAWSREAELTADRAAFLCCGGNVEVGLRSLLMLALGSRKYLNEISLSDYLHQGRDLENFYGKLNLWLGNGGFGYDHPYLATRIQRLLEFAYSDIGQTLSKKACLLAEAARMVTLRTDPAEGINGHRQITGQARFCSHCGFEIYPGDSSTCPICGSRVR